MHLHFGGRIGLALTNRKGRLVCVSPMAGLENMTVSLPNDRFRCKIAHYSPYSSCVAFNHLITDAGQPNGLWYRAGAIFVVGHHAPSHTDGFCRMA